ncbi:MAG: amidohydrolase family protein [Bacteroidota bacterium]
MNKLNRRAFVGGTAASAAGILLGNTVLGFREKEESKSIPELAKKVNLMAEVKKYRKIDSHAHFGLAGATNESNISYADRLGIEKLVISKPMAPGSQGLPEEFRACNDAIINAVKQHPDRFLGQLTLNPTYKNQSMEEIKRCIDLGFTGMKLYNHVKINSPLFYPIIEKFIDLKLIILMHSPIGKARIKYNAREPKNISIPEDFVDIAKRYPEAMFQFAHTAGGIDWEDACKALQHSPNVYVDLSGSNNIANMVEFALRYIGEDRLLFGCDNSFYQGVGHIISAKMTDAQRKKIFFDNYNNILRKAGKNVD